MGAETVGAWVRRREDPMSSHASAGVDPVPVDPIPVDPIPVDPIPVDQVPIVYTTDWCPFCRALRIGLDAAGVRYEEIDIEDVPAAAEIVAAANNGNHTVPTVVFADGTSLTNPTPSQVVARLAAASGGRIEPPLGRSVAP